MKEPKRDPEGSEADRDAAFDFLQKIGLTPTPDAIGQLAGPFAEALTVMCERGYDRRGRTWRGHGWRGQVHDILDKAVRLRFHSWSNRRFDADSATDLINFSGFYWRLRNEGPAWGEWGDPGDGPDPRED
jgi:hypothetical protein